MRTATAPATETTSATASTTPEATARPIPASGQSRDVKITRRELLGGSISALTVGFAGCSSSDPLGCDEMHRSSVEAEKAIPSAEVREEIAPIKFEDLPSEEKKIAAKAIRGDSYAECSPESDAFESFLDRIGEHRDEQQQRSDADLTTVYLVRVRTYYALTAMELDQMVSY